MATRRSRLQIKPNIGPKIGRGGPTRTAKSEPKEDAKKPNQSEKKLQHEKVNAVCLVSDEAPTVKGTSGKGAAETGNKPDTSPSVPENSETPEAEKSPAVLDTTGSPELDNVNESAKTEALDKKSDIATPNPNLEDKSQKKNDVRPKFRSRFPKAKPNLSNIGRPDKRKKAEAKPEISPENKEKPEEPEPTSVPKVTEVIKDRDETVSLDEKVTESPRLFEPEAAVVEDLEPEATPEQEDEIDDEVDFVERRELPAEKSIFDKPVTPNLKSERKHHKKPNELKKKIKDLPSIDMPPDRSTMRMVDLIYWNPSSNPMKPKVLKQKEEIVENKTLATEEENQVDTPEDVGEDSNPLPVPQVTIGPDGNIVINESSLVVTNTVGDEPLEAEVIEEDESTVNYRSFKDKRCKSTWTETETAKFYKALSTIGTDFSLMINLFPKRSRREIKNKFKKEERLNRTKVDCAIRNRTEFNLTHFEKFEKEVEEEERLKAAAALQKKESSKNKAKKTTSGKKKKKRKNDDSEEVKENKKVKRRKGGQREVSSTSEEEDDFEEEDDAERWRCKSPVRSQCRSPITSAGGRLEENMDESDSEPESEAPSVISDSSVFVPRHVRASHKFKSNVEVDGMVENQLPSNVEPSGDIGELVNKVMTDSQTDTAHSEGEPSKLKATPSSETPQRSTESSPRTSCSTSKVDPENTESSTSNVISVTTVGEAGVQHMEVPEGLLPVINNAGGADKVQIVLVHDIDGDSGQTVVHVYILPKSAEEFNIGGNTVQLTPAKSQSSTHTQETSVRPSSDRPKRPVPPSPVTPFKKQSSSSVTLAQTAAVSVTKSNQKFGGSSTLSICPTSPSTSSVADVGVVTPVTSPTASPSSRVCLFQDTPKPADALDLTVKKEAECARVNKDS